MFTPYKPRYIAYMFLWCEDMSFALQSILNPFNVADLSLFFLLLLFGVPMCLVIWSSISAVMVLECFLNLLFHFLPQPNAL